MKILLLFLFIWFIAGFFSFLIFAKLEDYKEFDKDINSIFWDFIKLGVFSLLIPLLIHFPKKIFINFMNWILKKLNGTPEENITYEEKEQKNSP